MLGIDPVIKYRDDFNQIVNSIWQVHSGITIEESLPSHLEKILDEVIRIKECYQTTFVLEKQDVSQALACLWYKYQEKWKKRKVKRTSNRDFLLQCSIWGIQSWYYREVVAMSHDKSPPPVDMLEQEGLFCLNFRFVVYGTDIHPFDVLKPYERYLIFLQYKMEKNIVEIARMVKRDRAVVSKQLEHIVQRLGS
jgi:hypothetical protein